MRSFLFLNALWTILLASILSCSSKTKPETQKVAPVFTERAATKFLSQSDSEQRSYRISDILYDLNFDLTTTEHFSGSVEAKFNLKIKDHPLTIDFGSGKVKKLIVNDTVITNPNYNNFFITVSSESLVEGSNKIYIEFEHPYDRSGSGLYRFVDPEDNSIYMYTDFEPYDANLLFPCFDQPDLKATYSVKVTTPQDFQVVTSVRESEILGIDKNKKQWIFPKSAKFSTYIFSLHAGHYHIWESKEGDVNLRLLARKSLAKYIDPNEWFTVTQQGLRFFNKYFDYPYPFKKYDQVIVPDFNAGAMENVAAVTFSERFVKRGTPTQEEREGLAEVILHEMAHMWFGNLVTMKWWNDLWLNESFASYMATLASADATEFKKAWDTFYADMKQWAYWEDQLVTTHPIEANVPHTDQAFANFDGITYGKGASVLQQLSFYIGADNFRDGVRNYFKEYQYQNAELKDFLNSIAEASGKNLDLWSSKWLQTSGVNTIKAEYQCQDNKIQSFNLVQNEDQSSKALRPHKTQIALYELKDNLIKEYKIVPVTYADKTTMVKSLIGQKCPDLVYPNHGDNDYVKVSLDERSLATIQNHLNKIQSPFTRLMIWANLWEMVRDQQYHYLSYVDLVINNLSKEKEIKNVGYVLQTLLGRRVTDVTSAVYLPDNKNIRDQYNTKLENFFWLQLKSAPAKSDFQKLWFDSYVKVAKSKTALSNLNRIIRSDLKIYGLNLDQDRRWILIRQLNMRAFPGSKSLAIKESRKDKSEQGMQMAMTAEVVRPELASKKKWFNQITNTHTTMSLARLRTAMRNLYPEDQNNLKKQFNKSFYRSLNELSKTKPSEFLSKFAESLVPVFCEQASANELSNYIKANAKLSPVVIKELKVAHQEEERCIKIRAMTSTPQS